MTDATGGATAVFSLRAVAGGGWLELGRYEFSGPDSVRDYALSLGVPDEPSTLACVVPGWGRLDWLLDGGVSPAAVEIPRTDCGSFPEVTRLMAGESPLVAWEQLPRGDAAAVAAACVGVDARAVVRAALTCVRTAAGDRLLVDEALSTVEAWAGGGEPARRASALTNEIFSALATMPDGDRQFARAVGYLLPLCGSRDRRLLAANAHCALQAATGGFARRRRLTMGDAALSLARVFRGALPALTFLRAACAAPRA